MAGTIITITSAKGGSGKTTMALSLANIYSRLNLSTLVIDLDLSFGGIALAMNKAPINTIYKYITTGLATGLTTLKDNTLLSDSGFDILASPINPFDANRISQEDIVKVLSVARREYDIIILDTTHQLLTSKLAALDNSDIIVNLMTSERQSIKSTRAIIELSKDLNKTSLFSVVLNDSVALREKQLNVDAAELLLGHKIELNLDKRSYANDAQKSSLSGRTLFEGTKNSTYKTLMLTYAQTLIGIEVE